MHFSAHWTDKESRGHRYDQMSVFFGCVYNTCTWFLLLCPFSGWIFQVVHVFALFKRKSALTWRFWWNWVPERVLKCFFRKKKFGKFSLIFRPNFLPKSYRAAIGPPWVQNVPDGCKTDISVPYVCTYGVRFFYEFILLRKENILDTQIMKKFHV